MTYITTHLPKLEELKKELEDNPERIALYAKYEGFDSFESGSIDFIEQKLKEYYKSREND